MVVRAWHLLAVGALALCAVTALFTSLLVGGRVTRQTTTVTRTVATMPPGVSEQMARQIAFDNVTQALPSMEAFYADNHTYATATMASLRSIDSTLPQSIRIGWVQANRYCLEATVAGQTDSVIGPAGNVVTGSC